MKRYQIYGVGNALVDTEYQIDEARLKATGLPKGAMTLTDEAGRQRLLRLLTQEWGLAPAKRAGGGSAANTLVTAAQLGSRVFYSCKVAADEAGAYFARDLKAARVDTCLHREPGLPQGPEGATGQCISLVTPDAERTMATCLGVTEALSPAELDAAALGASRYLYIEGYLVASDSGFATASAAKDLAKAAGVPIALTLSDPGVVAGFKSRYKQLLDAGLDLLFCNQEEARLLTGAGDLPGCIAALKALCRRFTITLGEKGSLAYDGRALHEAPGQAVQALDTTGAGDVYAGAFLHLLAAGGSFGEAARLANSAAAQVVAHFGARLSQTQADQLRLAG